MPSSPTRYRFADFLISPSRRVVLRDGKEQPIIPRYFDLLVLLVERRHEAVHRRDIFDTVWADVVVSDGALSQAIRTLRRLLGDDPRAPRFIRTVSRHGYQFVFPTVIVEPDGPAGADGQVPAVAGNLAGQDSGAATTDEATGTSSIEALLDRLISLTGSSADLEEERRDLSERLHQLGTSTTLRLLGERPGHASIRALLRDTRWDVPGAEPVPLLGASGAARSAAILIGLRLRRAWRDVRLRWVSAAAGAGISGALTGAVGGLLLHVIPRSGTGTPLSAVAVLAAIGALAGAWGGGAIGAGLAAAEAVARSWRGTALTCAAAVAGAGSASIAHLLVRWTLADLLGIHVAQIGGVVEGLLLGTAIGLAYAIATPRPTGGMATPRGSRRVMAVALVAASGMLAGLVLSAVGRPMIGGLVHEIARASAGSHMALTPVAQWVGEPDVGPWTGLLVGGIEGAMFGLGLAIGITRRPRV